MFFRFTQKQLQNFCLEWNSVLVVDLFFPISVFYRQIKQKNDLGIVGYYFGAKIDFYIVESLVLTSVAKAPLCKWFHPLPLRLTPFYASVCVFLSETKKTAHTN